jgi:cytidyltransferase-like protein
MKKIVLCTGGFDPIHSGHIAYFEAAKKLGDYLIVGINSDNWLTRKKGRPFMPWLERSAVINSLKEVDEIVEFDDSDNSSINAVLAVRQKYPDAEIIFANGGDRGNSNTPEMQLVNTDTKLNFVFGVGGEDKKNSSSWILEEWKNSKTTRTWGWYRVLDEKPGYKVKELVIEPGKSLSDQRHSYRSEHWYVLSGSCVLNTEYANYKQQVRLNALTSGFIIGKGVWHQAINNSDVPCHVLEVQHGEKCVEEDIERREDQ